MLQYRDHYTGGICQSPVALIAPIGVSLFLHLLLAGGLWLYGARPIEVIWIDVLEVTTIASATRSDASQEKVVQNPPKQKPATVSADNAPRPLKKKTSPGQPAAPTSPLPETVSRRPKPTVRAENPVEQVARAAPRAATNQQAEQAVAETGTATTAPAVPENTPS